MQLYYLKHRIMKRVGEPLYLLYDHYHEEYDVCTIEGMSSFGDNVKYTFSYTEIVKLTQAGFDFDEEWKIISLEDFDKILETSTNYDTDNENNCKHPNLEVSKYVDHAKCSDCGFQTSGWYCKDSPTLECEYYDFETGYYDEDCCIYCEKPEERK